ncbi:uncharacterized protein LOC122875354 [Siniperca chuatsi]|uniref:uncharacterized protein LOC122875354 n=1 Tax=Siniperca chuatsi TaxID=119488 RepID=UPI001CE0D784|nr:uncharacterized protein LOC122875354 [Siniperca chuatsi]
MDHPTPALIDWCRLYTGALTVQGIPQGSALSAVFSVLGPRGYGLTNIPPMDKMLAIYLAPKPNSASGKSTLPSRQCRFSAAQLEKIYRTQGLTARALNTASMLQAYQVEKLWDLHEALVKDNAAGLLDEVHRMADFILSSTAADLDVKGTVKHRVAPKHVNSSRSQQLLGFMASMIPAVSLSLLIMTTFQRWVHAKQMFPWHM